MFQLGYCGRCRRTTTPHLTSSSHTLLERTSFGGIGKPCTCPSHTRSSPALGPVSVSRPFGRGVLGSVDEEDA